MAHLASLSSANGMMMLLLLDHWTCIEAHME
jgi:hypothetical protein